MNKEAVSQIEHDYFQGLEGHFDYTPSRDGEKHFIEGIKDYLSNIDLDFFMDAEKLIEKPIAYRKAARLLVNTCLKDYHGQIKMNTTHSSSKLIKLMFTGTKDYQNEVMQGYLKTISQLDKYFKRKKETETDKYYQLATEDLLNELKIIRNYVLRLIEPKETLQDLTEKFKKLEQRKFPDEHLKNACELQKRIQEIQEEIKKIDY